MKKELYTEIGWLHDELRTLYWRIAFLSKYDTEDEEIENLRDQISALEYKVQERKAGLYL